MNKEKSNSKGCLSIWLLVPVCTFFAAVPIAIIGFPTWIAIVIALLGAFGFPIVALVFIVLYIWAFVIIVGEPISTISIIFFICLAVLVLMILLPIIGGLAIDISSKKEHDAETQKNDKE